MILLQHVVRKQMEKLPLREIFHFVSELRAAIDPDARSSCAELMQEHLRVRHPTVKKIIASGILAGYDVGP